MLCVCISRCVCMLRGVRGVHGGGVVLERGGGLTIGDVVSRWGYRKRGVILSLVGYRLSFP
jgi:hypothetical protein